MAVQVFTDQMGNTVSIAFPPKRIVSLVPSQTELLADLGLEKEIVGITKFCIHPSRWKDQKQRIGGTKNLDIEAIEKLKPDIIIGNKEENEKKDIEQLQSKFPTWISDIFTLKDALQMITVVGQLTDRIKQAEHLVHSIETAFNDINSFKLPKPLSILYLIWKKPWMGAASETFIDHMLATIGLRNCLQAYNRYPTLTEEQIAQLAPDLIFLSSEPYPFKDKHIAELQAISPTSRILLVDGEMFSWYGSRLIKSPEYLRALMLYQVLAN